MKKKDCLSNWGAEKKPTGCGCTNWHLAAAVALIIGTRFSGGAKINAVLCWHTLLIGFVSDAPALCKLKQPNLDRVWLKCFFKGLADWSCLYPKNTYVYSTKHFPIILLLPALWFIFHIHTLESNTKQEENPWSFSCWLKSPEPQGLLLQFPGAPCEWLLPLFPPSSSTRPVCIALISLKPIIVHKIIFYRIPLLYVIRDIFSDLQYIRFNAPQTLVYSRVAMSTSLLRLFLFFQ